jgi:hypothetical protein
MRQTGKIMANRRPSGLRLCKDGGFVQVSSAPLWLRWRRRAAKYFLPTVSISGIIAEWN